MAKPTLQPQIKRLFVIAFWAVFLFGYFSRFPLPGFLSKTYFLSLAVLTTGAAWGYGSLLTGSLATPFLSFEESAVFAIVSGFGLLSLLMVLMGVLGAWTRLGAVSLVGIGLCAAWPARKQWAAFFQSETFAQANAFSFGILFLAAGFSLLNAFSPVIYYDSLVYHFALPQAYIHAGHWMGQPELIYSAFPQMMEMIWTLGMLLASDTVANVLGWFLAIVGVAAVYLFAKRFLGPKTARWAAVFLGAMPAYMLLSTGGYIDVGLAVFSFLSFYALCLALPPARVNLPPQNSVRFLALAGFFAGCAIGCKYTGAIPLGIGALWIFKEYRSRPFKTILSYQAVFLGTALVIFSPWLLKNLYYVGNPVFPFFYDWSFNGHSPWIGKAAEGYFRGLTEYEHRSGWQLVKLLWDIAVNGLSFGGGMDVLGDLGWAPLFAFLPAIALARKRAPMSLWLLAYALVFYIPWAMSRPVLRFLMPLTPFLALAAAYGYDQGLSDHPKEIRFLGHLLMAILVLSGFRTYFDFTDAVASFHVPLGIESRTEYLTRKLDYYAAAGFVNTLPADSLTYVVGDQRGYYYNRPVLVTPVFNTNPLAEWANHASSAEDLKAFLKMRHITHLLINRTEMRRLDEAYHLFPFTPKGLANWEVLQTHLVKPLYHDNHCDVLAL